MHRCAWCDKVAPADKLQQCSACKQVKYCDSQCQRAHWKSHKAICRVACNHGDKCNCTRAVKTRAEGEAGKVTLQDKARRLLFSRFQVQTYKTFYPALKARSSRQQLGADNIGSYACMVTYESAFKYILEGTIKGERGALITVWDSDVTARRLSGSNDLGVEISFMYEDEIKGFTDEHTTVKSVLASFNADTEILVGAVVEFDQATQFCLTTFVF